MKLFLWVFLGLAITGLAFWFAISPWFPRNPLAEDSIVLFFMAPSVGAFWMLYMAIRYERRPILYVALAFIPYTFLWYYFNRVKPRRHLTRKDAN
jgi:hypothetical protein